MAHGNQHSGRHSERDQRQDQRPDNGDNDSASARDYLPLGLAADLTGYSRAQVQRLVRCGSIPSRLVRGRRVVHVGSLMQHRAQVQETPRSARITAWLSKLSPEMRDRLSFRNLAALARAELGIRVDHVSIYRAWKRLGLPPRRRTKD